MVYTQAMKEMSAFLTGYAHGSMSMTHQSPRDAQQRFPKWNQGQVDAYLNGEDDAIACDSWRMVRIRAEFDEAIGRKVAQTRGAKSGGTEMALDWRASQRMRNTFLADSDPRCSVILWRTLDGKWAWAVRDMTTFPMTILHKGEHRNRIKAAAQAETAAA